MLIILNPVASTMSARLKHLVLYALQGRYDINPVDTEGPGHATELCRSAKSGDYDLICTFGGDGTINEAANGLVGSDIPLTCLPGGATNVYCRILGIPHDVVAATEHLLTLPDNWSPRQVDLGIVNGRYFIFSAGTGFDASVINLIDEHPKLKAKLGSYFFTAATMSAFVQYRCKPPRVQVEVDGRSYEGIGLALQNASPYTVIHEHTIELFKNLPLDSGTFSAALIKRARLHDLPGILTRGFSGRPLSKVPAVTPFPNITKVIATSADGRPLPIQADGDYLGEHLEAEFELAPGVLRVVS
jgi:diacylglycerol kinase family enzyme